MATNETPVHRPLNLPEHFSTAKRMASESAKRIIFSDRAQRLIKRTLSYLMWLVWRYDVNRLTYDGGVVNATGRHYTRTFLKAQKHLCRGKFLEFGDPYWKSVFDPESIETYDILGLAPGPGITVVGDIQNCPHIPDETYDVIVCTMVLEHVANPFLAVKELRRILKTGGRLLIIVPSAFPYHITPDYRDYWRFMPDSLPLLFKDGFANLEMKSYGNRLSVIACYWYWMAPQLPRQALDREDPNNQTVLSLVAIKA
jgi:SAM-dependent methyltransferase